MAISLPGTSRLTADSNKRYYLGIDSGGTHTRALLTDELGIILGVGRAGSANPNHYTKIEIRENLRRAISEALTSLPISAVLSSVFMGTSGISTKSDRAHMCSTLTTLPDLATAHSVVVQNDTVIGLTGGLTGRPGIVLIAGTGSVCYGVNGSGADYMCGGWGAIADDIGSAPWIGTRAIQAAARAEDGRSDDIQIRDTVFDFLKITEARQLIHRLHNEGLDRAAIGLLAPVVIDLYNNGDTAALTIINDAVDGLAELVFITSRHLFGNERCELILAGGVALSGPPFQILLQARIGAAAPQIAFREPELSPVQGAVLEAMRGDAHLWSANTIENLKAGTAHKVYVEI
jgi:glucosamine kinase